MKRLLASIPSVVAALAFAGCSESNTGDNNAAATTNPTASTGDPAGAGSMPPGVNPPPGSSPAGTPPPSPMTGGPTGPTGPTGDTGSPGPTSDTGPANVPGVGGSGPAGPGPVGTPAGTGGTPVSPTGGNGGVSSTPGGGGGTPPNPGGAGGGVVDPTSPDVTVQLTQTRQLIRGFGINNNWSPAMTDQVADRLFGNGEGQLGMNILRVGMGSDGNPYNGQACYDDINKATARGAEYIMATLWSPPANCKTNNSIIDGGHLLESCYESWSDTIAAFADKIEQNTDTTLYAMSPQNEVDFASCGLNEPCNGNYDTTLMTGAEAAAFQKIVGPKLRAKGVRPMSAEASEWIHVWSNKSACCSEPSGLGSSDPFDCGFEDAEVEANCPLGAPFDWYAYGYALWNDQEAWDAFDIMGTHQYDSQIAYEWPADVTEKKEVWQTEMSGVKWWPEQGETDAQGVLTTCSTHIENGVAVARWIHSGLTVGEASAWLYWWYQAISTDDNEGLICKDGRVAKRMWTFGQFSKFIRPGYTIVNVTGALPDKVLALAATGPDGQVVVVAINETTAAVDIPITIAGGTAPAEFAVYQTSATDDIASKGPVTVTDGIFMASLPAMSVTTYVTE